MTRRRCRRALQWSAVALSMLAGAAHAAEYRSVAEPGAILYDAPSAKSKKLFVVGAGYPVEVAVTVEGWSKVRDASGDLAWLESKTLSERRTVQIKTRVADVRQSAADTAPLVFQAEQNVILDALEPVAAGWIKVRHRDGQVGFVKASQVWGAI